MNYDKIIASKVRELRQKHNVDQKDLAEAIGITRTALGNYETGIRKFPIDLIPKIADYFGVTVDFLYGRSDK